MANPQSYSFDPPRLVADVVKLMALLAAHAPFRAALADDPDYSDGLLAAAQELLAADHRAEHEARLKALREEVAEEQAARRRGTVAESGGSAAIAAAAAAAGDRSPARKVARLSDDTSPHGGGAAAAAAAPSPAPAGADGVAAAAPVQAPASFAAVVFSEPEPADVEAAYVSALGPLRVGTFDSSAPRAYSSAYMALSQEPAGDTQVRLV